MAAKRPKLRDRVIDFRRVKARDLVPHPRNWRLHPRAQSAALKGVLEEIGVAGALLAYEHDGKLTVIDGHLRKDTAPDHEWPVIVLDVTDAEADYLLATHDPLAAMAQPDQDKLLDLLASVDTQSQAVKDMLEALANGETQPLPNMPIEDVEPRIDEADALRKKWRVKRGQIWTLGEHRLMCGDSTADVGQLALDDAFDLIATSPPYLDARDYESGAPAWDPLMQAAVTALAGHCAPAVNAIVNLGQVHREGKVVLYWSDWLGWMDTAGWPLFGLYVWDKGRALPGEWNGRLAPSHEFVFHFRIGDHSSARKWIRTKTKGRGNHTFRQRDGTLRQATSPDKIGQAWKIPDSVIRIPPHTGADIGHPAMYPIALPEFILRTWSDEGDAIYDPFVGSGTTIIAAERLGRRCFAMEIEPRYVGVSLERWAEATGKTPVLDG